MTSARHIAALLPVMYLAGLMAFAAAQPQNSCSKLTGSQREQVESLQRTANTVNQMISLIETQIAELEALVDRRENIVQSYDQLESSYTLQEQLKAQRDEINSLIAEACNTTSTRD